MSTTALAAYRDFRARGGIADLSTRAKFRLRGADRVRYLHGQVSANVQRLGKDQAIPACVMTAKGRLAAEVFLSAEQDALLVDAEPELREPLLARLERYIISDDVTLDDVTDEIALLHCIGPEPATFGGVENARAASRFGRPGIDLIFPIMERDAVLTQLSAASPILDADLLEIVRIEAGIPRWGRELSAETLPPEAHLDRSHIDYHKGCYIGQEVISRLKSVGHVNRHLTGFVGLGDEPLTPDALLFANAEAAAPIGRLTSAAFSFALEKPIALGYLKRGSPLRDLVARSPRAGDAEAIVHVHELPFLA